MANNAQTADLHSKTGSTASRPAGAAPGGGAASMHSANPNLAPLDDAVAACYPDPAEAGRVADDLAAAGITGDSVLILSDQVEKRDFLKRYVHRDSDRHTHSNVASAFGALGGALAVGLIAVVVSSRFAAGGIWPVVAALVGGLVGAVIGALLGGFALRPADDRSMAIVESLCDGGTLVAVRAARATTTSLDEAGRILSRHNARAFRLTTRPNQADLHPGDTRTKL